jgi:hypothetical protein
MAHWTYATPGASVNDVIARPAQGTGARAGTQLNGRHAHRGRAGELVAGAITDKQVGGGGHRWWRCAHEGYRDLTALGGGEDA